MSALPTLRLRSHCLNSDKQQAKFRDSACCRIAEEARKEQMGLSVPSCRGVLDGIQRSSPISSIRQAQRQCCVVHGNVKLVPTKYREVVHAVEPAKSVEHIPGERVVLTMLP